MWLVITADGGRLTEEQVLWPNLPRDLLISELLYYPRRGRVHRLRGMDAFGFQRYRVTAPHGHVGQGAQLIGVKGKEVVVVEINEIDGTSRETMRPASELTYDPELLRHGRG